MGTAIAVAEPAQIGAVHLPSLAEFTAMLAGGGKEQPHHRLLAVVALAAIRRRATKLWEKPGLVDSD